MYFFVVFLVALCCMNYFRLDPLSSIQINVYDENKVNISDTSDEERKTVHYRFYNKWIGTMQVPLYDVLTLGSVSEVWQDNTEYLVSWHITLSKNIFGRRLSTSQTCLHVKKTRMTT